MRILYMCFIHIVFMIIGFREKIESQHVADPQMEKLLKMMEGPEIILREERQILDLQLETKREQFKMKNGKCPKLFGGLTG